MRLAHALAVLVAVGLAACGGKSKTSDVTVAPPAPAPPPAWTVERALATMGPDVTVVIYADVTSLAKSPLVAEHLPRATEALLANVPPECKVDWAWEGTIVTLVTANSADDMIVDVFFLGVQTESMRRCSGKSKPTPGVEVIVDGDVTIINSTSGTVFGLGFQILDDHTMHGHMETGRKVDRTMLDEAVVPRSEVARFPELAELRASSAPVWMLAPGTAAVFRSFPPKFTVATLTAEVGRDVKLEVRARFVDEAHAAATAMLIEDKGPLAVSAGYVSSIAAHADGDTATIRAKVDKESIENLAAKIIANAKP